MMDAQHHVNVYQPKTLLIVLKQKNMTVLIFLLELMSHIFLIAIQFMFTTVIVVGKSMILAKLIHLDCVVVVVMLVEPNLTIG